MWTIFVWLPFEHVSCAFLCDDWRIAQNLIYKIFINESHTRERTPSAHGERKKEECERKRQKNEIKRKRRMLSDSSHISIQQTYHSRTLCLPCSNRKVTFTVKMFCKYIDFKRTKKIHWFTNETAKLHERKINLRCLQSIWPGTMC